MAAEPDRDIAAADVLLYQREAVPVSVTTPGTTPRPDILLRASKVQPECALHCTALHCTALPAERSCMNRTIVDSEGYFENGKLVTARRLCRSCKQASSCAPSFIRKPRSRRRRSLWRPFPMLLPGFPTLILGRPHVAMHSNLTSKPSATSRYAGRYALVGLVTHSHGFLWQAQLICQ